MQLPFTIDLKDKVVVITGAAGVICSHLSRAIAQCGAKVAILGRDEAKARQFADELNAEGYTAKGFEANVLIKDSLEKCREAVLKEFGKCDILINGAGGNNPKATTDNEYAELDDATKGIKTFFDLDQSGVEFVFNLNFIGTLLPTQVFSQDMVGREGCNILNISSMNAYTPLTKIPAYSGAKTT